MTSDVPDTLDVPVSYVVSNPDAFVYFDEARPTEAAYLQLATPLLSPVAPATDAFGSYVDARNCATFDDWPYGLKQRSGYSKNLAANSFADRLSAKNVTYLLGRWDVFRFDSTCPAMAQGPTRLARGIAYSEYMNTRHNADHAVEIIRPIVVGQPITDLGFHLAALVGFGLVTTWIATALFRRRLIK